ncbi:MAG: DNA methyltransferase [Verrucomicrobiota bacterium]
MNNKIKSVGVNDTHLTVELLDGRSVRLPLTLFPTLAEATAKQRAKWELCGADTGIHWPLLDYDLSVAGLLRGEPEAPGIRRAKKSVKYPAHKSGKAYALAEEADSSPTRPSSLVDTRVVYCGDNLEQLAKLPDACVDLIYIDPPFNSNRNYEVFWGETKEKRAFEDRHESTRAYIDYMRPRCVQLARVLKKTGSFYYHCDWHASHYVKVMLDQIFGENYFQNEIVWKRTSAHNDPDKYGNIHDTIFYYRMSDKCTWNTIYTPYSQSYIDAEFRPDENGRLVKYENLTAPSHGRDAGRFEWRGTRPPPSRMWSCKLEKLEELFAQGKIKTTPEGKPIMRGLKTFLDELPGIPLQSVWDDIPRIGNTSSERLGYPTQKPLALLERMIKASSNENDIVLDAFCGCGTALVAAQNLKRQWIGIDISPTACRVMAKRLRDVCGLPESEPLWKAGRGFVVRDLPWSEEKLRAIPPFEFENWAVIALGGIPNKVQVGDMGVDGRIYPVSSSTAPYKLKEGELGLKERWYPIQVKQKDKVGRPDIDSFEAMMMRENCEKGFFVSFDYSSDALQEIESFFKRSHKVIVALTVQEILDEHIARKLA